jgi:hypothetical protein
MRRDLSDSNTPAESAYSFWLIRKQRGVASWQERAEILQQQLSQASMREDVRSFERRGISVNEALTAVNAEEALTLLPELLLEQTHAALTHEHAISLWVVMAVKLRWRSITTRMRQLKDIEVVLGLKADTGPAL